jgi:hypothetical protein
MTAAPYKPVKGNLYRTIYSLMRLQGDTTRQYLAEMTGLPPTSLNRALDKMMQCSWIEESGLAESTGGRRPNLYCLSVRSKYIVCISPGPDRVSLSIIDQSLAVVESRNLPALPEITAEEDSVFEQERLDIWWDSLLETINEVLAPIKSSLRQAAGVVLITEDAVDQFVQTDIQIISSLIEKFNSLQIPFKQISSKESRFYCALWKLSRTPQQTMLAVFADHDSIYFGIARNGLRHCGDLVCLNAGTLLASQAAGDSAGHLERQISQTGMLKRFCKIKSDKALTWQDFIIAAGQGKRKAVQVLEENSALLSEIVFNALQICKAEVWVMAGSMTDELPLFANLTAEAVTRHAEKAGFDFKLCDKSLMTANDETDDVIFGAAASMIENLLSEME